MRLNRRAQTMLEYTVIIGIVTVVLYYMGTSIKRGVESLVKVTADQVGNQENSDQDFTDYQQGYMISSIAESQENKAKLVQELGYIATQTEVGVGVGTHVVYAGNTSYDESSLTMTNTFTNGGFSPTN